MGFKSHWDYAAAIIARQTENGCGVLKKCWVCHSDSGLALITGKGKTLKKYTLKDDFAARKADMILEIGHKMLWGKDFQALCKANIAMTKELLSKYSNYGSQLRVISPFEKLVGKKTVRQRGLRRVWGQTSPDLGPAGPERRLGGDHEAREGQNVNSEDDDQQTETNEEKSGRTRR